MIKTCKYCQDPFDTEGMPHNRDYCSKDLCCQKRVDERKEYERIYQQERRARIRGNKKKRVYRYKKPDLPKREKRLCKAKGGHCLGTIDNGNLNWCSRCHRELTDRYGDLSCYGGLVRS